MHRVQKIVNFAARVVTGRRRYDHIADAIKQLGWLTAEQIADYHTLCAVRLAIVSQVPECIANTIGQRADERHQHNTRNAHELTMPRMRTETGKRRLCYRGVKTLSDFRVDPHEPIFRNMVKRVLLDR